MDLFSRIWKGYVKIRLQGPEPERFIRLCAFKNIAMWNIRKETDQDCQAEIYAADFKKLGPLRYKTKEKIKILEKHGLPFFFLKNRKRKAFFIGMLAAAVLLYGCSLFIWDIRFDGNHKYTTETLMEAVKDLNVDHGTKKKEINCRYLSENLRKRFPGLVWVSVKIKGNCLLVDVKENEDSYEDKNFQKYAAGSDILMPWDGIIENIVTRKGMPMVKEGQECKKGDILVTGKIDILNQDGEVLRQEKEVPDADIEIRRKLEYYDEIPMNYEYKRYEKKEKKIPYLKLYKKIFPLAVYPGGKGAREVSSIEKPVYLTPTFCLPVSFGIIKIKKYRMCYGKYGKWEIMQEGDKRINRYLKKLAEKKIYIYDISVEREIKNDKYIMKGYLTVRIHI